MKAALLPFHPVQCKMNFYGFFFVVLIFESAMGMQFLLDIIILKFQITRKGKVMEMI